MDIIVCHRTAFLYWRSLVRPKLPLRRASRTRAAESPAPMTPELLEELASLGIVPTAKHPVDLLFATPPARSQHPLVRCHVHAGQLPPGSFVRVAPHVLMAGPELTFAQIASKASFVRACMLGAELCGAYTLVGPDLRVVQRKPLTSASAIREHIAAYGKGDLSPQVRRVVKYLPDGAASPREARLVLLLSFPTSRGGYGLPAPTLNREVRLSPAAYSLYPCTPCRLDLSWPDSTFTLEYEGREPHAQRAPEDIARAAALALDGYEVMTLTNAQVAGVDAFDAVARHVAARLGHRLRIRREDFPARRGVLRRALGYSADGLMAPEAWPDEPEEEPAESQA